MVSFNFFLDKVYKPGNLKEVQASKRNGKPITKFFNPQPTAIYLVITFRKHQLIKLHTGEKIKPKGWDFVNKEVKPTTQGSLEMNDYLLGYKRDIIEYYREIIDKNPRINFYDLKELLQTKVLGRTPNFDTKKDLLTCFDKFTGEKALEVKDLTMKKYRTLRKTFIEYMDKKGIKHERMFCEHINTDFYRGFRSFLIERRLTNATLSKYVECIKVFMRWARKKDLHQNTDFEDFSIKREPKDIVWLTVNEVNAIQELNLEVGSSIDDVRNIFLFQIYTGQRFGDIPQLYRRHLNFISETEIEWHLYQQKGNKAKKVIIPLLPPAVEILGKYCKESDPLDNKVFPTLSNVHTNKYLKKIGEQAKINETTTIVQYSGKNKIETCLPKHKFITTHTARRTFVCLSFIKGLNANYITSVTGHDSIKTMNKYYLSISQEAKKKALFEAWA